MRKKIIGLLTLGLLITVVWSIFGTYAETEVPSLSVGDSWTYEVTDDWTGEVRHHTVTIDRIEDYEGVSCYVWITTYPESTLKEWITTEEGDWVILKLIHNITENHQENIYQTYSPGLKLYDFPLSLGKEWSGESNVTLTVTISEGSDGEIMEKESHILSWQRKVVSAESITVPAGTFDTYLVEEILFDDYETEWSRRQHWYFCENVTNYVKNDQFIYEEDQFGLYPQGDLISYELAPQDNDFSNLYLPIALGASIGVLGFTSLLYYRRNRYKWGT